MVGTMDVCSRMRLRKVVVDVYDGRVVREVWVVFCYCGGVVDKRRHVLNKVKDEGRIRALVFLSELGLVESVFFAPLSETKR